MRLQWVDFAIIIAYLIGTLLIGWLFTSHVGGLRALAEVEVTAGWAHGVIEVVHLAEQRLAHVAAAGLAQQLLTWDNTQETKPGE